MLSPLARDHHPLDIYAQQLVAGISLDRSAAELHELAAKLAWQLHWDHRTRPLATDTLTTATYLAQQALDQSTADHDAYLTQLRRLAQLQQLTGNALRWLEHSEQLLLSAE